MLKRILKIKKEDLAEAVTANQQLGKCYKQLQIHKYLDIVDGVKSKAKRKIRSDDDDDELRSKIKLVED